MIYSGPLFSYRNNADGRALQEAVSFVPMMKILLARNITKIVYQINTFLFILIL